VPEPVVVRELDRVCAALTEAGYAVVEDGTPLSPRAPELWGELVGTETLEFAMPVIAEQMSASSRQHTEIFHGELMALDGRLDSYIAAYVERGHIARATAVWMEEHPLVVAPVAGMPAPPLAFDHFLSLDETRDLFNHMRNVLWVNLLNLPSISLPNGIQIVARRFHEAEALAAASVAAEALGPVSIAEPTGVAR
jgi:amidase